MSNTIKRIVPAIVLPTLVLTAASAYTIRQYRTDAPIDIIVPVLPDSLDKENAFAPESLLGARSATDYDSRKSAGYTTLESDSTGRVMLQRSDDKNRLQSLATRIRADRFAKGKLQLSSTSRALVRVDGQTLITKNSADSTATEQVADIVLLPHQTYDIDVEILSTPSDPSAPQYALEFLPDAKSEDVQIASGVTTDSHVTPLTVLTGERTYGVSLSPDGKYMLATTYETVSATDTRYRGRLYETATGKLLQEDVNPSSQWMPVGNKLYYTMQRGDVYDVYTSEVPSMRVSKIASDIPDNDFSISPDGKYLIYYKTVKAAKKDGPMHRVEMPDDRIPGNRDRVYMMRYDLETKTALPVTYGGPSTGVLAFTNDGSKMLYSIQRATPDRYPFYYQDLIEMDMNTLRTDTLVRDEESYISAATYSPDGKSVFICSHPDAFGKIGANYGGHEMGNGFDVQGFIMDIATRRVRAVTRDFDPSIAGQPVWNRVNGKVYFLADQGFNRNIYCLDPKTDRIEQIEALTPFVRRFSIGDNEAEYMAYYGGGFTTDGTTCVYNMKTGKSRVVADPLAETTKNVKFGDMSPWTFTADDGTLIDGYLCLPPDFDASKKYPLIVYYYGGTTPTNATFYHLYTPQVFASRGYVVYAVNPSGTIGYGQEFSARHVNAWGKRTADDIIEGVKEFCKAHPYVNDKKIGCIGASYGGFMTMYLQTQTDIFAAAVSHAGISNVTSYWGEGYWGYSYNAVAAAKSYPWNNPDLFTKQGALFNADKIHTPILLLHGEVDTNVPIGESIQLFNALRILGRDVEFISVEGENHVISNFDRKQVWQNTIMAWFAKWLQDDPRWWDTLYGE